jgi:Tfp pilus assembly protein PilN
MDRINLIPDDVVLTWHQRFTAYVGRKFVPVLVVAVVAIGMLQVAVAAGQGFIAGHYAKESKTLETQRANLMAELDSAQAYLGQLDQAEQQLTQQMQWLGQRIVYLSSAREQEGAWADTLRSIKRALPYGVWLTELESSAGGQLRLAGGAFSDTLVGQFMGDLKTIPRFTNVAFTFTRQDKIGKTDVVVFEITCQTVTNAAGSTGSGGGSPSTPPTAVPASPAPEQAKP